MAQTKTVRKVSVTSNSKPQPKVQGASSLSQRFSQMRQETARGHQAVGRFEKQMANRTGAQKPNQQQRKEVARGAQKGIQSRLGNVKNSGVQKKSIKSRVVFPGKGQKVNGQKNNDKKPQRNGKTAGQSSRGKGVARGGKPKKMDKDSLDKELEAYMLKDPKTASALLDADIESYKQADKDDLME